jgi:hypothetical protein
MWWASLSFGLSHAETGVPARLPQEESASCVDVTFRPVQARFIEHLLGVDDAGKRPQSLLRAAFGIHRAAEAPAGRACRPDACGSGVRRIESPSNRNDAALASTRFIARWRTVGPRDRLDGHAAVTLLRAAQPRDRSSTPTQRTRQKDSP